MTRATRQRSRTRGRRVSLVALAALAACPTHDGVDSVAGEPGMPLASLRSHELAEFHAGRALFEKVYLPEEGLGPLFNENQCSACHTVPATGGTTGFERVVKATRFEPPDACLTLRHEGGENVRTQATPRLRALGIERQSLPPAATEVGRFTPPFLFGLGLIENVPAEAILRHNDPNDDDGDGISGRAGRTSDGRLARFGRKADFATIRDFVASALRLEMGLTSPQHIAEDTLDGFPAFSELDHAADPDVSEAAVTLLATFVRFLVPPAAALPRSPAHADTIALGRRLFDALACSACHTPSMRTGTNEIPALDRKTVALYSDLLLHDMGPALANVCAHGATPFELRSTPLMGLRHRDRLLHDGRTSDLAEAILAHGGEAQTSRDAFARLPWLRQQALLQFLRSL